ncbi:hypothetical protein VKS41_005064 [Umbelopsis sp. WA50703]|jgi:nucleoside-diphosphate-sugar epimerase
MSNKLVLLTGSNGFVGAHVCRELLTNGYRVRAVVRSQAKADQVAKDHQQWSQQFDGFAVIPDITQPGVYDKAVQGVDYVMHVASPFTFDIQDNEKDLLIPAREGTKNILQAASKQSSIKRVVITSSCAALFDLSKGIRPGYTYTEQDWNPATWDQASKSDNPRFVYCASKKIAEQAAWQFIKENNVSFDITTMCMPMIYGPILHSINSLNELNESNSQIWKIINGENKHFPPTGVPAFVDVRDTAVGHVRALTTPEASNTRYVLSAGSFRFEQAAAIAQKRHPQIDILQGDTSPLDSYTIDGSKAKKDLLHRDYITFDQCISDTADQLFELAKKQ